MSHVLIHDLQAVTHHSQQTSLTLITVLMSGTQNTSTLFLESAAQTDQESVIRTRIMSAMLCRCTRMDPSMTDVWHTAQPRQPTLCPEACHCLQPAQGI